MADRAMRAPTADDGTFSCAFDPQRVAALLKVLAHPARLNLLCRLHDGEVSVADLETETGIGQPGLSQHLAAFRDAAIVTTRREHKTVFYRLSDAKTGDLLEVLCRLFGTSARARASRAPRAEPHSQSGAAMFAIVEQRSGRQSDTLP